MVLRTHLRSSQVVLVELHPYHLEISFFYKNLKKNKAGTVFIGSLQVCQDVYMCVCVICSCSYCLLLPWHIFCRLSREGKTIWYS